MVAREVTLSGASAKLRAMYGPTQPSFRIFRTSGSVQAETPFADIRAKVRAFRLAVLAHLVI